MEKDKTNPILLIAGEGGHLEQARRFNELNKEYAEQEFIVVTDEQERNVNLCCDVVRMNNISALTKQRTLINVLMFMPLFIIEFFKVLSIILKNKPHGVIAFGPIFCVPFIFWARILGLKTVYIETWSKFYEPTITAKICKRIAHRVYIQNITLKDKLSEGIYAGKL